MIPLSTLSFGMIVTGFAGTQRNMLLGMNGSEILRYLATSKYYKDVMTYLMQSVYSGIWVSLVSVLGMFVEMNGLFEEVWFAVLAGSISLVICVVFRNERVMANIIRQFLKSQGDRRQGMRIDHEVRGAKR